MAKRDRSVRVDYPDGTSKIRSGYPVRDGTHEGWRGDEQSGVATVGITDKRARPPAVKVVRRAPVAAKRRTKR